MPCYRINLRHGFSWAVYSYLRCRRQLPWRVRVSWRLPWALFQHALSNIISGIFIVIFKPFESMTAFVSRMDCRVVEDITLRHVVIRDF